MWHRVRICGSRRAVGNIGTVEEGSGEHAPGAPAVAELISPNALLRFPSRSGRPGEQALAAANERAFDNSLERLRSWTQVTDLLTMDDPSRPDPSFSVAPDWLASADLGDICEEFCVIHDCQPERIRLAVDAGRTVSGLLRVDRSPYGTTKMQVGHLASMLAEGAWFLVLGVDEYDPSLNALAEDLDRVFGSTCRLDVCLGVPSAELVESSDRQLRWLVVERGEARVRLVAGASSGETSARRPAPGPVTEDGGRLLTAGQGVVIPPGWSFTVEAEAWEDFTTLLLMSVRMTTNVGVLADTLNDAVFWPLLRADLPYDRHRPIYAYDTTLAADADDFADALARLADDGGIERAIARGRAVMPPRHRDRFGARAGRGPMAGAVRSSVTGGFVIEERAAPELAVVALGHRILLPDDDVVAVAELFDGGLHDLAPFGGSTREGLVRALLDLGWIERA